MNQKQKKQVAELAQLYWCGGDYAAEIAELSGVSERVISERLAIMQSEWDNLPCGTEGPTTEQDEAMEQFGADFAESL